jgi:hypothetical protein
MRSSASRRWTCAAPRRALFDNSVRAIDDVPRDMPLRQIRSGLKAVRANREAIAKALGIAVAEAC